MTGPASNGPLLSSVFAKIDQANEGHAKALREGQLASSWIERLRPDATDELRVAARAHHLRRWTIDRSTYPEGRNGYLRWRRDLKSVHAEAVAEVLAGEHLDIGRVQELVQKKGLGKDPETQALEDAICLTFLEVQFDDLADRLDDDHMVDVLRKTMNKMSPEAIAVALTLELSDEGRALLERAATPEA